jgi:hypothetical protein
MRYQTDFLTYHTSTTHPTEKIFSFFFWLFSKSTTHSQLALANRSTRSSSGPPTPRFWLTNRMMEDFAITSCTSSRLPLACQRKYDGSASLCNPTPPSSCVFPSGILVRIPLDPLGSLANALDNIRGVTRKRILVTVTGIVRPPPLYRPPHPHFFLFSSERNSCDSA